MTSEEVLQRVENLWASRRLQPEQYPVVFKTPRLETDPMMLDLFREEFDGLPLNRGFWWVHGEQQLPPDQFVDPPGPTFLVDNETGTVAKFLSL